MSLKGWKTVAAPALVLGLASPFVMNCGALAGLAGGCEELKTGDFASFKLEGSAEVSGKFKGVLEGVFSLGKVAAEAEATMLASCKELGTALGMSDAELTPPEEDGVKKVCMDVAAKIEGIYKANAEAKLSFEIGEPSCYVPMEAMMNCVADCGVKIDPGQLEASCSGGELSASCEGKCEGGCTLEAGAECSGKCDGTCDGKCDGKVVDTKAGGKCDGKCEGKCSGGCKVEGQADCKGRCSGKCEGTAKAPSCTGEFKPPSVEISPECHLNCMAKTAADFTCDPPSIIIKVDGKANADMEKLVGALRVSLPKIIELNIRLGTKIGTTVAGIVKASAELAPMASQLAGAATLKAAACGGMAVELIAGASGSISGNVELSGSFSTSAKGEAKAGG